MEFPEWTAIHSHILTLEQSGLVTRTFRRLDPERQQTVLQAIIDDAVEHGPTAVNIKRVAARARISVGSLYNYFGSRDRLLEFSVELCTRYVLDMFVAFKPYMVSMPLRQALSSYLLGGIEWSHTQTGLVQFFLKAAYEGDEELYPRFVEPISEVMLEIVREILSGAVERGEVRADIDLDATARIVNSTIIALGDSQLLPYLNSYLRVTDSGVSLERIIAALLDLVQHGIADDGFAMRQEAKS